MFISSFKTSIVVFVIAVAAICTVAADVDASSELAASGVRSKRLTSLFLNVNSTNITATTPVVTCRSGSTDNTSAADCDSTDGSTNSTPSDMVSKYMKQMGTYECYTNLTYLQAVMFNMSYFDEKVIHLCPNTTYSIGELDEFDNCCAEPDQQRPIWVRGNTKYLCGLDGTNPDDNCILRGGSYQVRFAGVFYNFEPIFNVLFKGITFAQAYTSTISLGGIGDVTFEKCRFRDVRGFSPMENYGWGLADLNPSAMTPEEIPANTAYDPDSKLQIIVANCSFFNNSFPTKQTWSPGIFFTDSNYHNVSISNTLFYNNSYNNPQVATEGWAIKIQSGNILSLTDNCFYDNEFLGDGVVLTNGTIITKMSNNFAANNNEAELECQFHYDMEDDTCVPSDTANCMINGIDPIPDNYKIALPPPASTDISNMTTSADPTSADTTTSNTTSSDTTSMKSSAYSAAKNVVSFMFVSTAAMVTMPMIGLW